METARESIRVINGDLSQHPHCRFHGPALLFSRRRKDANNSEEHRFFACSANRNPNECPISTTREPIIDQEALYEKHQKRIDTKMKVLEMIKNAPPNQRGFCEKCNLLVPFENFSEHTKHMNFDRNLTDDQIVRPTQWLRPLANDTKEAQYFFAEPTLVCLTDLFIKLNFRKIICIGAPRLHEHLRFNFERFRIKSVLLDLDVRLEQFFGRDEFFLFNMFNSHFPDGTNRAAEFQRYLCEDSSQTCIFTDPPFGCRTEPLVQTIKTMQAQSKRSSPLPVIWIFPYFMETYVRNEMPEMEMLDYHVNYSNHKLYSSGKKGRKQGSPIRLFTNILPELMALPLAEGYAFCRPCRRWRLAAQKHCQRCGSCTGKNGAAYVHCERCAQCVKPNYKHCTVCRRCTQVVGHNCAEFARCLRCWICRRTGHSEWTCAEWFESGRQKKVEKFRRIAARQTRKICFVCGQIGHHNETKCPLRAKLLDESRFCGAVSNMFG